MTKKFYDTTWVDMSDIPFPLEWYREIFHLHHYTMSEKALDYWNEYRTSQFWPQDQWDSYIITKIETIVRYAYENVPFYKKLYDQHGVDVAKIKTADDLQKLPLVDKASLTLGLGELSTTNATPEADKLLIKTSGSTGARMSFTCDQEQLDRRWAVWMRLFEWTGWQWGNKEMRFWFKFASTVKNPKIEAFDAFLSNRHFCEFNKLDPEELSEFCDKITNLEPYVITGYWEAIEAIAKHANSNKILLNVSGILPSTQVVTSSGRKLAERVFGCTILDKYASAEFSGMGHQCEQGDLYHIQSENVFIEILRDGKRVKQGMGVGN